MKKAFTLIELLVVIAIIAILAAIVFPVFARAKEAAKKISCLSNVRQIGMSYQMYATDNDDFLPLTLDSQSSWVDQCQPYLKSRAILRCPSDTSSNWDDPTASKRRKTSYFINFYMTGDFTLEDGSRYCNLTSIPAPSSVIYLAESVNNAKGDHFHPMDWESEGDAVTEIALGRHTDGANYAYVDGHARWSKFSPLWFKDPSRGVVSGSFDPRNEGHP